MIKKLFSFIFCLTPIGAMAVATPYTPDGNGNIAIQDTNGDPAPINITATTTSAIVQNAANGTKARGLTSSSFSADNMIVGVESASADTGYFYINKDTLSADTGFTIQSDGAFNVTNALQINAGQTLSINAWRKDGINPTNTIAATIGSIENNGTLAFNYIDVFTANGEIRNTNTANNLRIDASSATTQAITNNSGTMEINVANALKTRGGDIQNQNNATSTVITAGSLTTADNVSTPTAYGAIQNNAGEMTITLNKGTGTDQTGNLTAGKIENKNGTSMNITAANIIVNDTMTNEGGQMVINANNLTVSGGDSNNASFVNGGNLYITVSGQTSFAHGINFSAMETDNIFSLTTGSLDTTTAGSDNWLHMFSNKLDSFTVKVTNDSLNMATTDIINGQAFSDVTTTGAANATANMTLSANGISAKSVTNAGNQLNMTATTGAIDITNGITATSGITNINATTTISAGAVTNDATTTINGTTGTTLASITNNATGTLNVFSGTNASGKITVTNDINNSGTLEMRARDITMGNLTNTGGTTTIEGSDTNGDKLTIGTVTASGGVININSLLGDINVDGDLWVKKTENGGGSLNIGSATKSLTTTGTGKIQIDGDVTLSSAATAADGAVNIGDAGVQDFVLTSATGIDIKGDITATDDDFTRKAQFIAGNNIITVGGNVAAAGLGNLIFGNSTASQTTISGNVTANKSADSDAGGSIEFYGAETSVGSLAGNGKFITHGELLTATNEKGINIADKIRFDNTDGARGLIVKDTDTLTLKTTHENGDITVGGIELASGNTLNLTSGHDITVIGTITENGALNMTATNGTANVNSAVTVTTNGALKIDAATINTAAITNNGTVNLTSEQGDITTGALTAESNSTMDINAADSLTAKGELNVKTNAVVNIAADDTEIRGPVTVNGNMVQDDNPSVGALNIVRSGNMDADSLTVYGDFIANGNMNTYNITNNATITGDITVNDGNVFMKSAAGTVSAKNITNDATLSLAARTGINITEAIKSTGALTLDSGTGQTTTKAIDWTGTTVLAGAGLKTDNAFEQRMLYQNYAGALSNRDVNVKSNNYAITTTSYVDVMGIAQTSGQMILNTDSLDVAQNINATGLRVVGPGADTWLNVGVGGNVSGNTRFENLKHMSIGGNYTFNDNSGLVAAILPFATSTGTTQNYWATVNTDENNNLGKITKPVDGEPLISVGGKFITDLQTDILSLNGETAKTGQFGIKIFDMIDQGTAIWLLHADGGIEELATKIRNLNVQFCNADGTKCFDYYGTTEDFNGTDQDLPAYLTVRDTDDTGTPNDVFIVFDPRFGGPLAMFKIQPVVGRDPTHTKGEYTSAGALDDLIAGQLQDMKFNNRTPIDAIPVIFKGTNMEQMANQLYDRMEYYDQTRDGAALSRFSRLFQAREIEQMTGSIALNEHTSFRDFEDHMLDEFIWNRNRNLRKAWGEFDFGMFSQREADGHHADGNRFSFTGGYDWQETNTLILGLAGRVSHMSGSNDDHMDLGYRPGESIAGNIDIDVADTNFGLGAYLLQNLGTKMRAYGNAFLDLHWLDVSRKQTYMSKIDGDGTAFSLISEWGLMHDWLNQYIVGNVYARVGYNFGFSVTEKAGGDDYMKLKSDGYFIFTPGYTLTAQKRIYPSAWFQMRPYASIGVEYDVLGAPDKAKYKFAAAKHFTDYDIEIDPLWANIGGGMEFLSVTGVQVGLDYRYQYNADIQMHKIKLSGSYRF